MDANQRSEINNQTNNGANEKGTPGAKGRTTDGPLDHTYPNGASQQQAIRGDNDIQSTQDPSRMGRQQPAAEDGARTDRETSLARPVPHDLPGGSLQSQQTGGSGAQQGITDSHQRQMEQHSGAWGLLEQPVGHRDRHAGTDVNPAHLSGNSPRGGAMDPQNIPQPELQGGSLGRHHDLPPDIYQPQNGETPSNRQSAAGTSEGTGMAIGPHVKRSQP